MPTQMSERSFFVKQTRTVGAAILILLLSLVGIGTRDCSQANERKLETRMACLKAGQPALACKELF